MKCTKRSLFDNGKNKKNEDGWLKSSMNKTMSMWPKIEAFCMNEKIIFDKIAILEYQNQ